MSNDERFTELGDAAQRLNEEMNAQALRVIQARSAPETHPDFDGVHCVDMGEEIPPERLALGKVRCIDCQRVLERRSKR